MTGEGSTRTQTLLKRLLYITVFALLTLKHGRAQLQTESAELRGLLSKCVNDGPAQQLTTYEDFASQKPARYEPEGLHAWCIALQVFK